MREINILSGDDARQLNKALFNLKSTLDKLIGISDELIPDYIFSSGIPEYFYELCQSIKTQLNIAINFSFQGNYDTLDHEERIKVYRIIALLLEYFISGNISVHEKTGIKLFKKKLRIYGAIEENKSNIEKIKEWQFMILKAELLDCKVQIKNKGHCKSIFTIKCIL